jgi:hypothetical protein
MQIGPGLIVTATAPLHYSSVPGIPISCVAGVRPLPEIPGAQKGPKLVSSRWSHTQPLEPVTHCEVRAPEHVRHLADGRSGRVSTSSSSSVHGR